MRVRQPRWGRSGQPHTNPTVRPDLVAELPSRPKALGTGSDVLAPDTGHRGTVVVMATRGITTIRGPTAPSR
ncbi:hypothetical protein ACIRL2_38980 [Embleya sp. NPDC127516]|uniref:hypothetical protein n=1 Tax=Embleya sp. NPDC127516 TaxID=3363990 RepID=UPI0037FCAF37